MWENMKGLLALPEDPNQRAAAKQGLLGFGAALLGGRGDFGGILGDGLMAGAHGYQSGLQQQQQAALQRAQQQRWELENKQTQAALAKPSRIASAFSNAPAPGSQPPAAASSPALSTFRRPPALDVSLGGYTPRSIEDLPKVGEAPALASAGTSPAATDWFAFYRQRGDKLAELGYMDDAKDHYALAEKLRPKLMKRETLLRDGKPVSVMTYEDGTEATSTYGALPSNRVVDLGGTQMVIDENIPQNGKEFVKSQSPDSKAADRRAELERKERAARAAAAAPGPDGLLSDETIEVMVDQYLAGDTSVMTNLGRGAQGAQNIVRLRNGIARRATAEGKTGRDLAAQNAEYFGTKAGQRSAGTRIANVEMASYEAESLIPLARDASAAVSRSGLLPFGKGQVMFNEQTNDPAMRQFAAANNALVNVYSRAISPSGVPTVADKEHAREMIATAMDDRSYQAVLDQMQKEITAARQAPQQVRRAFNDAVTGKGGHGPVKDVKDLPKKPAPGVHPADISNLLNKYGAK